MERGGGACSVDGGGRKQRKRWVRAGINKHKIGALGICREITPIFPALLRVDGTGQLTVCWFSADKSKVNDNARTKKKGVLPWQGAQMLKLLLA